jgi:hypothetical protein
LAEIPELQQKARVSTDVAAALDIEIDLADAILEQDHALFGVALTGCPD